MKLEIELWQLVGLLVTFFGAVAAAGKLLLSQSQRALDGQFAALDKRFVGIEEAKRDDQVNVQRLEREMMAFQAAMPLHYVRREDYIRGQSIIEAKLDGLASKLENAQLRGILTGAKT